MQSWLLRAWKLGPTTSHLSQVLSLKCDMGASMATLLEGEARLRTCVGTTPAIIFAKNYQDPTLMIINQILMIYSYSKVGFC